MSDNADAWTVEPLPIHGYRIRDHHGQEIVKDVYDARFADQIVTEHNQHATLVAERERLLRLLRPVTSPTACYCAVMGDEKCWHCEARELTATIEPETEVRSNTSGEVGSERG